MVVTSLSLSLSLSVLVAVLVSVLVPEGAPEPVFAPEPVPVPVPLIPGMIAPPLTGEDELPLLSLPLAAGVAVLAGLGVAGWGVAGFGVADAAGWPAAVLGAELGVEEDDGSGAAACAGAVVCEDAADFDDEAECAADCDDEFDCDEVPAPDAEDEEVPVCVAADCGTVDVVVS
jgi:hypothetical protein